MRAYFIYRMYNLISCFPIADLENDFKLEYLSILS